ncbi:MAG: type 4a pilus biogenesis protein PilO [Candidatus Eisenbacteria bacterium]|nr:type 4a pilus biogenesis protein PilO [Candidatus Eisenbacteria bacterium]
MNQLGILRKGGPKITIIFSVLILLIDLVLPGIPFSYSSFATRTKEKEERLDSLEQESVRLGRKLSGRKETMDELAALRERWNVEKDLIPAEPDVASMLTMISLTAIGCGVTILLVKPEQKRIVRGMTELPVSITVAGGYHETARFISDILNLPRLLNVSQVKFQSYTKGGLDETVEATMIVTGYSHGEAAGK